MKAQTFKIHVKGRVQGVGFRPFVYRLAQELDLAGTVSNDAEGVIIVLTTTAKAKDNFLNALLAQKPHVSVIHAYSVAKVSYKSFDDFKIIPSQVTSNLNLPLTPDFAVCETCKKEINNPSDRRYGYAFATCVSCGPRYAITTEFPFERAHTSLADFEMCAACKAEYSNPSNRRFHSQTNSCSDCGVQLELTYGKRKSVLVDQEKILKKAITYILEGKIIAVKNTSGYLLCCDANNAEVIERLRQKKKRPNKPFAVLYPSIEHVYAEFSISSKEKCLLTSTVAPVVILENTEKTYIAKEAIAPNLSQTGVMLPSSALLALLMNRLEKPMVCTSGNIHGSPIISEAQSAKSQLKEIADCFIHNNLPIQFPQDDSVVKVVQEKVVWLRRSRGLAPNYLSDNEGLKQNTLAMGAHLKSSFALVPNAHTYLSQYFGNLDNYEVLKRYKNTIEKQLDVFNCKPKTILIDKHPSYQSSVLGKEFSVGLGSDLIPVQHHKAHFASVLAEHQLFNSTEQVLGVVWDGSGYGDDGAIWGGEFFIYGKHKMERISHFKYYDWIANDKMASEPRIALFSLLSDEIRTFAKAKFSKTEWRVYSKMRENNTLKTSSVGRLFDAVASALNLKDINSYEAEASMLLEKCALQYRDAAYIDFLSGINYEQPPTAVIMELVCNAIQKGISKKRIAASFIYTLANCVITLSRKHNIQNIACSGGVFQNGMLISMLLKLSETHNKKLKLNRKLSGNDENIAFGQLHYFEQIKN